MMERQDLRLEVFERIEKEVEIIRRFASAPPLACDCGSDDYHLVVEQSQTENGVERRVFRKCSDCVENDNGFYKEKV